MSTESQTCSPIVQRKVIAQYAAERGIQIVRSYADEGKSGLTLSGRHGLRSLLEDIQRGDPGFSLLLVFDVSRWGRFQNTDESAYYEFQCRKAGVLVTYCAEAFENDDSPYSAVVKSLKRIMAAEYSRELSNKVYLSHREWAGQGFYCGGVPGYGRRRLLVDDGGLAKWQLGPGDRKGLRSDRVVIIPGPSHEVAVVREIYRLFVEEDLTAVEIAKRFSAAGKVREDGRPWSKQAIYKILVAEKYSGANIYGRTSQKLHSLCRKNPRHMWVHVPDAFQPVVDPDMVARAQAKRQAWTHNLSDEEFLRRLRVLWEKEGRLDRSILEASKETPSHCSYRNRFGSMHTAFAMIGYPVASRLLQGACPSVRPLRKAATVQMWKALRSAGLSVVKGRSLILTVEGWLKVTVAVADQELQNQPDDPEFWNVRFGRHPRLHVAVIGRLNADGQTMRDWFVVPRRSFDLCGLRFLQPDAAPIGEFRAPQGDLWPTVARTVRQVLAAA